MNEVLSCLKRGLIVSCQAHDKEVFHGPVLMAAMAVCAERGGACGIRANGVEDIAYIRRSTRLPIIGILKTYAPDGRRWITPTCEAAAMVLDAGSEIVAVHATREKWGDRLESICSFVHSKYKRLVMADCQTFEDMEAAAAAGVDIVATTLAHSGHPFGGPDFDLIEKALGHIQKPLIAEGGYWRPEEVVKALDLGAHAVVVGTAITRPMEITKRFVAYINQTQHLK